jgi:hypothetical protein
VEECRRPWSSPRPTMAAMLWHAWEPVTHAGADGRVRPHVSMAEAASSVARVGRQRALLANNGGHGGAR